jgi:hypothetical protein
MNSSSFILIMYPACVYVFSHVHYHDKCDIVGIAGRGAGTAGWREKGVERGGGHASGLNGSVSMIGV